MSVGRDAFSSSQFATLDAAGLVELCGSLADYGEAGGLSRELMLQVGVFGEARFGGEVEVQLAVARMYLLGGESTRARDVLTRAAQVWPDEPRVRPLLAEVRSLLDAPNLIDDMLRESEQRRASAPPRAISGGRESAPPRGAPRSVRGSRLDPDPPSGVPEARPTVRMTTPARRPETMPVSEAARAQASRWLREPLAPTPVSGMPRVPRAPTGPRGLGEARGAAVRAPVDEPLLVATAEVRTEVARRVLPRHASPPPESADLSSEPSTPRAGTAPRTKGIRLLDPDDERRLLEPYELIGEIASGGMATVFLARLAGAGGFQRFVAIKRLYPHLEREEQFVKMFLDEARLAAGIHHPHVVPILEVGVSDAGYYLVMEFIEGDTLSGLIRRAHQRGVAIPPSVAARIVLDSLAGLSAAHQLTDADGNYLGLVHRDCTPQNILVGVDGSARITDFGVARAASRLATTQPQEVKGKLSYLSPEQAQALEPLDQRSDVFTMGIVLWEALAGRPLFRAETVAATLARLRGGQVPSLRGSAPALPEAIDEVCRRALAQDRERRYHTAAEMAEALEDAASAEGFGGVASPRALGQFVEGVMGAEIAAQRESVRAWLSQVESRGPRSSISGATLGRGPATPRRVSVRPERLPCPPISRAPTSLSPISPAPEDDAPETPMPRGEKVPRLSSEPPEAPNAAEIAAAIEATPKPEPQPAAPAQADEGEAIEVREERAIAPPEPARPAAEPTLVHRAHGARAMLPPSIGRLIDLKVSTRTGFLLVVVIVLVATAPLGYAAWKRHQRPPAAELKAPAPAVD